MPELTPLQAVALVTKGAGPLPSQPDPLNEVPTFHDLVWEDVAEKAARQLREREPAISDTDEQNH